MEDILEMTLMDQRPGVPVNVAHPSQSAKTPSYLQKHDVNTRLSSLEVEIQGIDEQIKKLTALRGTLIAEKDDLTQERSRINLVQPSRGLNDAVRTKGKGKAATVDYTVSFDWSTQLQLTMKKVFNIGDFRLCQKGSVRCPTCFLNLKRPLTESAMPIWMAEILCVSCPPVGR